MKHTRKLPIVTPGEILLEEFLKPFGISQYRLAKDIFVPPRRINEIVLGKRAITVDTAIRLSTYFGTSPEFWLNLQMRYDLEIVAERQEEIQAQIAVPTRNLLRKNPPS